MEYTGLASIDANVIGTSNPAKYAGSVTIMNVSNLDTPRCANGLGIERAITIIDMGTHIPNK